MCGPQLNICKTTDRNRPDYSGFYELTWRDQRARRRRALDWKTLLLHHLLNPCPFFSWYLILLVTILPSTASQFVDRHSDVIQKDRCVFSASSLLLSLWSQVSILVQPVFPWKNRCENNSERSRCIKPNTETRQPWHSQTQTWVPVCIFDWANGEFLLWSSRSFVVLFW